MYTLGFETKRVPLYPVKEQPSIHLINVSVSGDDQDTVVVEKIGFISIE